MRPAGCFEDVSRAACVPWSPLRCTWPDRLTQPGAGEPWKTGSENFTIAVRNASENVSGACPEIFSTGSIDYRSAPCASHNISCMCAASPLESTVSHCGPAPSHPLKSAQPLSSFGSPSTPLQIRTLPSTPGTPRSSATSRPATLPATRHLCHTPSMPRADRTRKPAYDTAAALAHLSAADPKLAHLIQRAGPFTLKAGLQTIALLKPCSSPLSISSSTAKPPPPSMPG